MNVKDLAVSALKPDDSRAFNTTGVLSPPPNALNPVERHSLPRGRDEQVSRGKFPIKLFKSIAVVACPPSVTSGLNSPMQPTGRLRPAFTHVQGMVKSGSGLKEARVRFSPVFDTTTRAFYDYVVVFHSNPRRLLQNFKGLTVFASRRGLPSARQARS
jgi:hypothetical protein